MGKSKRLNGIAGNLALSYLSTLGYYNGGYMADWLNYIARKNNINEIEIDILNNSIKPKVTDIKPLKNDLNKLKNILRTELDNNGFEMDIIRYAFMKFEIPINKIELKNTVFCTPIIEDITGKRYTSKNKIVETALSSSFNPSQIL